MTMNDKILSGVRGFLILSIVLVATLSGCAEENTAPIASPELLETGADNVIYRMVTLLTVNGIQEARVEADTAYYFSDSTVYSLRNPTMILYNEQGVERARVVSLSGRLNLSTKEFVARGDVVLTIPEGDRQVETQELNYDPNGDRIWSDSASVMREGATVTRGQSFESDLDFQRAEVVRGSMTNIGEEPPPRLPERGPPGG